MQMSDLRALEIRQDGVEIPVVRVDVEIIIVLHKAQAGVIPDVPGELEVEIPFVGKAAQKVRVRQVDVIELKPLKMVQPGQERQIPDLPMHAPDMKMFKLTAACGGRKISQLPAAFDIQRAKPFQLADRADIPQRAAVRDLQRRDRQAFDPFEIGQAVHLGKPEHRELFRFLQAGEVLQRQIAQRDVEQLAAAAQRRQVESASAVRMPEPEVFQPRRREAGKVRSVRDLEHVDRNSSQSFAGRQSAESMHRRKAQRELLRRRARDPVDAFKAAAFDIDALELLRAAQIGKRGLVGVDEDHGQAAQVRHQADKAQIVPAGGGKLLPRFLAVPVHVVPFVEIGKMIPGLEGVIRDERDIAVCRKSLDLIVLEESDLLAHDHHVLDGREIFLGDAECGGNNDRSLSRHGGEFLSADGGAPDQKADERDKYKSRRSQDERQAAFLPRQRRYDALCDQGRVAPGRGNDVARVQRVLELLGDRRVVELQGQHLVRPRADEAQQPVRQILVLIEGLRKDRKDDIVLPRRVIPLRNTQTSPVQLSKQRLQLFPVVRGDQQADPGTFSHSNPSLFQSVTISVKL